MAGWDTAALAATLTVAAGCGGAEAGGKTPAPSARPPATTVPMASAPAGFWDAWGDAKAEIDTYDLVIPRYGQKRAGSAVLVFVTEDFTDGQRVKSDGGHGDEFPVLKLNDIRHFQTGIYDYEVMTSTFVRIDGKAPVGLPVKVSLGMQEWCGHVYEQLVPRGAVVQRTGHSYFDGEADHDEAMPIPADAVLADGLPIVARGLVADWPAAGGEARFTALPTLMSSRFAHKPPAWTPGSIRRGDAEATITVPAGTFQVTEVTAELGSGASTTWQIEVAPPHRIVRWTTAEGEVAELVASERLQYWSMNHEGDEAQLAALGLATQPTPALPDGPASP